MVCKIEISHMGKWVKTTEILIWCARKDFLSQGKITGICIRSSRKYLPIMLLHKKAKRALCLGVI